MKEAFPLHWPEGYRRTIPSYRIRSQFKQSMDRAQQFLRSEVGRLGGGSLIVSSNIPIRQDGGMYADWMRKKIEDPGVAIYFKYKGKDVSMCCDQYTSIWENVYALGKGIEALRGMERWGVSEFLDRAFTGFTALPSSNAIATIDIWLVLGLNVKPNNVGTVHTAYKAAAKKVHPDVGGSTVEFQQLQEAYNKALQFFQ